MAKDTIVATPTEPTELEQMRKQLADMQSLVLALQAGSVGHEAVKVLADRSAPKENPNWTLVSPFTYPAGSNKVKATLRRPTFFCGARQREDELTPEEVDLFNAITETRRVTGKSYGDWIAEIRRNGTAEELYVDVPAGSVDARMDLPSLKAILGEILTGTVQKSAAEVQADLLAKVAELERRIANAA